MLLVMVLSGKTFSVPVLATDGFDRVADYIWSLTGVREVKTRFMLDGERVGDPISSLYSHASEYGGDGTLVVMHGEQCGC